MPRSYFAPFMLYLVSYNYALNQRCIDNMWSQHATVPRNGTRFRGPFISFH